MKTVKVLLQDGLTRLRVMESQRNLPGLSIPLWKVVAILPNGPRLPFGPPGESYGSVDGQEVISSGSSLPVRMIDIRREI
jgi:hypothetical protein